VSDVERRPWDRLDGEPIRDYQRFRTYRDMPATERNHDAVAAEVGVSAVQVRRLASRWRWTERALAWDDEIHKTIDDQRLRDITEMHSRHVLVGKVAVGKALLALQRLQPEQIPAGAAARLLELGTRIERDMLSVTPEDLLGAGDEQPADDAWDALARELAIPTS
jgi:hypothetical protein